MSNISGQYDLSAKGFQVQENSRSYFSVNDFSELKNFLRVQHSNDDDLLSLLLKGSQKKAEKYINNFILPANLTLYYSCVNYNAYLPYANFSVTSVTALDSENVETLLVEGTDYLIKGTRYIRIELLSNRGKQFKIIGTCSLYDSPSEVDEDIRVAIMHIAKFMYENRKGATPDAVLIHESGLPLHAQNLLSGYINYGN